MVLVAVGTNKREIDVLGLTFGQKSITGSGGYSHEDVMDVMKMETPISAPCDGTVTITVAATDKVATGATVAVVA